MGDRCSCGKFELDYVKWVEPILDFTTRVVHRSNECCDFPDWTQAQKEDFILSHHPATFGVDRMGFFSRDGKPHPDDCPCGGSKGKYEDGTPWPVYRVGDTCFLAHWGTYSHLDALHLDWNRQRYLALAPYRRPSKDEKYECLFPTYHGS